MQDWAERVQNITGFVVRACSHCVACVRAHGADGVLIFAPTDKMKIALPGHDIYHFKDEKKSFPLI